MAKHSEMERVEAARALLDTRRFEGRDDLELAAFMDIFHPGHPGTDEMVREKKIEIDRRKGIR